MERSDLRKEINRLLMIGAGLAFLALIGFGIYSGNQQMSETRDAAYASDQAYNKAMVEADAALGSPTKSDSAAPR